ncbi:type II CAAX endopeptidase family protein [Roseicyclus sp. F158]|uniref:Type II CAAX endopeptidase family protein n=1 Tax=Tropicimonas omnivorans TaxID=3075590 RepID=A0ABU3DBI1_9RHOB|nr:type II CAAX endopeptidase family protein [Roseicyclus sp. F158]MDT0681079.1 type II CAAX endopeptidase family protein [Roseicyclus sp. F158]
MRHPEFEAMLHDARLYPRIWRIVAGLLLLIIVYVGCTAIVLGITAALVAGAGSVYEILPFLTTLAIAATPGQVLALLLTFSGMFIGALVAAAALHFRGPESLFGPWSEWRRGFLAALAVALPVLGLLTAIGWLFDAPAPNLDAATWAMLLPLSLSLLLLQTGSEELVFRGYLMQQLAARFRARWIWFWLPAILFALLHWSPEAGANLPLVLLSALTFGLIAADLTERTGSLGAAMGLHFANNFIALLVVSIEDTITGLALYVSDVPIGETGVQSLGIGVSIVVLVGIWAILRRVLDR